MVSLDELVGLAEEGSLDACLLPIDSGLADWPVIILDAGETERFSHGNPVDSGTGTPGLVRVYGPNNQILGIGEITNDKNLKPKRLMVFTT
jgi:tRNA pseudouridine55 synthase